MFVSKYASPLTILNENGNPKSILLPVGNLKNNGSDVVSEIGNTKTKK